MSTPAPIRHITVFAFVLALLAASCSGGGQGPTESTTSTTVATTTTALETTTSSAAVPTSVLVIPEYPDDQEIAYYEDLGIVALGRLNVLVDDLENPSVADDVATAVGGEVVGAFGLIGLYQVQLPDNTRETLHAAIETVTAIPGVTGAFADGEAHMLGACESTSPLNSPAYQEGVNAAHYGAIGIQEAWDIISASGVELHAVHVGVVDTAFMPVSSGDDGDVQILTPRGTTDQPSRNEEGEPDMGHLNHGTAVTHVIAADGDDGGVAGVASILGNQLSVTVDDMYDRAPGRVVDAPDADNPLHSPVRGGAYILPTLEKIFRQVEEGATVINMSFGPEEPDPKWRLYAAAYRRFFEKMAEQYPNVVFVAAAGNEKGALDGDNYYPGGLKVPNLITVGAVDHTGAAADFTNTTSGNGEITIAAPGVTVPLAIDPTTDQVYSDSGTSFSAPMVTGAIALIQSINPDLTAAEISQLLQDTARDGVAASDGTGTSKLIPDSVGGKIMRVDDAVLVAINKARAAAEPPQPALDRDKLLAAVAFSAEGSQTGFGVFEVTAGVEGEQTGTMSFELFGEGIVSGGSSQTATGSSPAVWEATPADPALVTSGKVCRTDAGRCCVLTFESESVAGSYSGGLVIGIIEATGDVVMSGPEGDETVTKEECESVYSDLVGTSFSVEVALDDDGSGTSGSVTASMHGPDGDPMDVIPTSWTMSGSQITIGLPFAADGYGGEFVLEGTLTYNESGSPAAITGTWTTVGILNLILGGDFTLTRSG